MDWMLTKAQLEGCATVLLVKKQKLINIFRYR